MSKEKTLIIPGDRTRISTLHETRVVESPFLAPLRARAFQSAGLTGTFDGSVKSYKSLAIEEQRSVDGFLSDLVKENLEALEANREGHEVIEIRPMIPNLALDQGLNNLMTTLAYASFNNVAVVGTGTTPTFVDSGVITATSAGTTVTSSAGIFTSGMTGWMIQFNSGEQRYITFTDTTHVTIDSSLTIGSPTLFTVYAVNQTGLDSESKRSHTFLTGSGNTGSSDASGTRTYKVTHDFSAEVSNQNYTELGWSNTQTVAANLNARSLVSGGTVTVLIGQQLRTVHQLSLTPGPLVSTPGTYSVTGWPVAPSISVDGDYLIPIPLINGTYSSLDGNGNAFTSGLNEVGVGATPVALGTSSTLPAPNNLYVPGTAVGSDSSARLSYTTNSFFRDVESTFGLSTANRTDWRAIYTDNQVGSQGFCFVFDESQTKDNTHVLKIRIRYSVARVLTNP